MTTTNRTTRSSASTTLELTGYRQEPTLNPFPKQPWSHHLLLGITVMGILVIAVILRFALLATHPLGLNSDEAAEGLSAQQILHLPNFHPVFFDEDGGREGLFAYLVAGVFRVFGASVANLRMTSAILGTLAVIATFLAARRYGRITAITAMGWTASSLWLVAVSRDGFRDMLVPLIGALTIWTWVRWSDHPSRTNALIAGAIAGLGLWTYQPLKLLPLLALVWLWSVRRYSPLTFQRMKSTFWWSIGAYIVISFPILVTAIIDPQGYFQRSLSVSPLSSDPRQESWLTHITHTLGVFLFTGDPNQRHNVDAAPLLNLPLFILGVIGLTLVWRQRKDPAMALIFWGLPIFWLPGLIARDGLSPNTLRLLGLAPFIAIYIGVGGSFLVSYFGKLRAVAFGLCSLVVLSPAVTTANSYFARSPAAEYQPYAENLVQLANLSNGKNHIVLLDNYQALVLQFLDFNNLPKIVSPKAHLDNPNHLPIYALNLNDIRTAAGNTVADRTKPVAYDPQGNPSVWLSK